MTTKEEMLYVEKVGLNFEQLTLPRMAGRIFGCLLISESPLVSMGEIVETLQASKSSVSTMLRLLIQIELVEQVSLPRERRDYYRIHPDTWTNSLKERLKQAQAFRQLAEEGLDVLAGASAERRLRLEEMRGVYALLEREIPALMERWEAERKTLES
jgi:DNA-binding transcriptional regulator GbsR (MarR family)